MKSRLVIAAALLLAALNSHAAVSLTYYDAFAYSAGTNLAAQGGWLAASGSGTIKVGTANLTYAGLTNGVANNVTLIPSGTAARTYVSFTPTASNNFFVSFLLKVNSRPSAQEIIGFASSSTSSDTTPSLGGVSVRSDACRACALWRPRGHSGGYGRQAPARTNRQG